VNPGDYRRDATRPSCCALSLCLAGSCEAIREPCRLGRLDGAAMLDVSVSELPRLGRLRSIERSVNFRLDGWRRQALLHKMLWLVQAPHRYILRLWRREWIDRRGLWMGDA
jgi:hypothetical protein